MSSALPVTSRSLQLVDYDRFNNSLTKLRDKKEKSLSDEKNLYKVISFPPVAIFRFVDPCRS